MCRKPDFLVPFYLIYFYIYGVLFTYFLDLLFSKTRQHLRCNLLFGLIGHFGLSQDVNISFFLSFFLVASLNLLGKSLKMSKNIFLQSFYKLRNKCPTPFSSLRRRLIAYMFKVKKSPSHRLPNIAWEASKCVPVGCKI